jgi:hypothetical protein
MTVCFPARTASSSVLLQRVVCTRTGLHSAQKTLARRRRDRTGAGAISPAPDKPCALVMPEMGLRETRFVRCPALRQEHRTLPLQTQVVF